MTKNIKINIKDAIMEERDSVQFKVRHRIYYVSEYTKISTKLNKIADLFLNLVNLISP